MTNIKFLVIYNEKRVLTLTFDFGINMNGLFVNFVPKESGMSLSTKYTKINGWKVVIFSDSS